MNTKLKVYNFISEQLTTGNLKRSDRLTEQYLVDHLGLSRTPIREALLQLTADDIIEREPRKGFKLKTYTKRDVEEVYELIGVLDGKIAEEALPYLTNKEFSFMGFLIDSMDAAIAHGVYTKYNDLQEQFHCVYTQLCKNETMKQEVLNKKKIFIGKAYSRIENANIEEILKKTNDEHRTILQLLQERKGLEVRSFLEKVHWRKENAQYDVW
ncbi:GntR family transcriptional regulator [Enterococcus ratti]|uniref:Transcriptional regulator GntR family n=1 Tax=Enterococcus ratti TaxID=150033 RepID=A0A1L8WRP8_9ENTE|nr:GntR family transcriptional regulator [Enterococcus ratti]OJG83701.1 transcriptional regulator GntR family [Enterococcus ratti]